MGKPIAFLGAFHVCPATTGTVPHVGGVTLAASPNVFVGGMPVARQGDKLVCAGPPDTITGGSTGVFVNGKPIARMGDKTAHGGYIAVGNPTVTAGDKGPAPAPSTAGNSTDDAGQRSSAPSAGVASALATVPGKEPGRLYGGDTLPCGGRDATNCTVLKNPATEHLDKEQWRKPKVVGSKVYPLEGSRTPDNPITIRHYSKRGSTETLESKGRNFTAKRDEQGFPEFTIMETYIPDKLCGHGKKERDHFRAANKRMGELLKENPHLAQQLGLTDEQRKFFLRKKPSTLGPPGLTWHHHQDVGKMQLVYEPLHGAFKHTGGMSIWGGGYGK